MFATSNHMTATRGESIGERRVFALHRSKVGALQFVLVHTVDVLLGFHLVGGDGQSIAVVLGKGLGLARCHEHAVRVADALRTAHVARKRHCDLLLQLIGARRLVHRKEAPKRMRAVVVVGNIERLRFSNPYRYRL